MPMPLQIKKMGIEWGAAFEEAQPHEIFVNGVKYAEIYLGENYELYIEIHENNFKVCRSSGLKYFTLEIDTNS